jgi:14-3-3 protein epsilon
MAKLAEDAERYNDMVAYMKRVVELSNGALEVDERNLLSVAYKNLMSNRRSAVRHIADMRDNHEPGKDKENMEAYEQHVCNELYDLIKQVREVIAPMQNVPDLDAESYVFFKKMEGDYNRYGAENNGEYIEPAKEAYADAEKMAESLDSTNPIRLGLTLNHSVFFYEICEQKDKAIKLAKESFDAAINKLDCLSEQHYKDSTLIMQLLKDNLTLWDSADGDEEVMIEDVE